jgi:HAD superfamily hydrolase (TIGR01490 family)
MTRLAIFDIDGTLIKGQTQQLLLKYLRKKKVVSFTVFIKINLWFVMYKVGLISSPKKIMEYAFSFLNDWPIGRMNELINDFFDNDLKPRIYKKGIDEIGEHQSHNRIILLVSNAIEPIVKKISEYLQVTNYICTKLEITNNKYTGKIEGDMVYGKNKVPLIQKFISTNNIDINNTWGYGDHASDVFFLEMISHPTAVNPDKKLAKIAKLRNWPVIYFE